MRRATSTATYARAAWVIVHPGRARHYDSQTQYCTALRCSVHTDWLSLLAEGAATPCSPRTRLGNIIAIVMIR